MRARASGSRSSASRALEGSMPQGARALAGFTGARQLRADGRGEGIAGPEGARTEPFAWDQAHLTERSGRDGARSVADDEDRGWPQLRTHRRHVQAEHGEIGEAAPCHVDLAKHHPDRPRVATGPGV